MNLTDTEIGEFSALFKKETGKDITPEQAREYALNLLHFVALVMQPESVPSDPQ